MMSNSPILKYYPLMILDDPFGQDWKSFQIPHARNTTRQIVPHPPLCIERYCFVTMLPDHVEVSYLPFDNLSLIDRFLVESFLLVEKSKAIIYEELPEKIILHASCANLRLPGGLTDLPSTRTRRFEGTAEKLAISWVVNRWFSVEVNC